MVFQIDVPPGVVAATFFIIFDVLILALLDVVLAHVVCAIYYRNIHHGHPINVKSADIPGVTTYLLGKIFSITNVLALGLKIAFIIIVFAVNMDVDGEVVFRTIPQKRVGVFDFDPSQEAWGKGVARSVQRNDGFVRSCYNHSTEAEDFAIYQVAFNLSGGVAPASETQGAPHGSTPIDDQSLACLDNRVREPQVVVNITGCSPFRTEECANGTVVEINPDIASSYDFRTALPTDVRFKDTFNFRVDVYNDSGMPIAFPDYNDPVMFCSRFCPGIEPLECCSFEQAENCNPSRRPCILVARIGNDTLVERWRFTHEAAAPVQVLQRDFPGPTFEGQWNISMTIIALQLLDMNMLTDWRTLALRLVGDTVVYRRANLRYDLLEERSVTKIPTYAVVLGAGALMIAVLSRTIVYFTVGKDDRPRFNSIDGLSSIVREENSPSGRSYQTGATAVVGLSHRGMTGIHFGPLQHRQESIARGGHKIS